MLRIVKLIFSTLIVLAFINNSNENFNFSFKSFWTTFEQYFNNTENKPWKDKITDTTTNKQRYGSAYHVEFSNSIEKNKSSFNYFKRPYLIKIKSIQKKNTNNVINIIKWAWIIKTDNTVHCIFLWSSDINQCFSLHWHKCEWYKTCKLQIKENYWKEVIIKSNCEWVSKINTKGEDYYSQFFCSDRAGNSVSTLDIDWDWKVNPLNDWIIIQRYLYWERWSQLSYWVIWKNCKRCNSEDIVNYINLIFWENILDINWDWKIDAYTDWLLLYKWMEWKRGPDLVSWLSLKSNRYTWKDISEYIEKVVMSY